MAVVCTGQKPERLTTVGDFDYGAACLLHALLQGDGELFQHQDGGTPVKRVSEEVVPIGMDSTQRHEERLRCYLTGIRRQTSHRTTRGASQDTRLQVMEEVR